MKKTLAAFGVLTGLMTAGAAAHAGVFGEIGTTGAGAHVDIPLRPDLSARVGMGQLSYSYKGGARDLDFDFRLHGKTYDVLLDWYPSKDSSFHLTTGLAYNGNTISGRARSNAAGGYTIQGNTYQAGSVGSIDSRMDFNKIAPYLGIGWGRPSETDKGWRFSTDVGVLFQGRPKTSLTSSGCSAGTVACNQLAADLARENGALGHEAGKLKLYPVLRIGISYKF
ncbi:hypothetical protein [Noviherbaspirillum massiliense]|uniref:hypothetical protein n=1 Tax=Noviherbaspirillum massiliense TaxID=1465823 RepID=UPI00031E50F0|nr:hypothetical protein [Noviherbaspirillum massiliense]